MTSIFHRLFFFVLITASLFNVVNAQSPVHDALSVAADSLNRIAFDHPEEALVAADSLIAIALKNERNIEYGLLMLVKGVAETSLGNNTEALQYHMQSYNIFDSVAYTNGKIFSLCNIATVHINLENYKQAEDYLFKALSITDSTDANNLKNIYANIGVCYDLAGNIKQALVYYNKSTPYLLKLNDNNGLAVNYHNMAVGYGMLDKFQQAELYGLKALEYQSKTKSKNLLAMIALSLGSLYTNNNQLDKAKTFLDIGGNAAEELNSPYYKDEYFRSMADLCKAKGDYTGATKYLESLVALRDTMHSEEKQNSAVEMEAKFQNNLKSKEIELLKVQQLLSESTNEKNRVWRIVLIIITSLCLILIIVLYRNYQLKQKSNLELKRRNTHLENENILAQFETLKNQLSPHFLFNSLNALTSLIKTDPDKATTFANMFSSLFRNTLELREKHLISVNDELKHVNSYLYLQKMRFDENLIVKIDLTDVDKEFFIPPFSVQLVVENAIKHNVILAANPLTITMTAEDGFLIVANNYQARRNVQDSTKTGLKNIMSRYSFFTDKEPVFELKEEYYYAKLPLLNQL